MKIVFLHHANVCKGGIERMLAMKANLLVEQYGCDVVLLTYEQNGQPFPYSLSPNVRCVDLGVRQYPAYKLPYPMRYFRKLSLRRQLKDALRAFLKKEKPGIVVCTDKDAHEMNALYHAHTSEKLIIEAHTGMIDHQMQVQRTNKIFRKLVAEKDIARLKLAVSRFDALMALTPDDAKSWGPYIKTVSIPNCLPYRPHLPADLSAEKKRVIAVGRLDYQKGQDLLLKAWKRVEEAHPDWRLDIFGDGQEKAALNSQLSTLNLKNVTLHPSTTDIYTEYLNSDFLVCSSRWESFGLILIEAMSCGIPAVSFDCDNGPRSIIADGQDGLLVKNGDTDDLADKINYLIEHPDLRQQMGRAAYKNVSRFSEEEVFKRYLAFYKSL
ncbi:glycosyltransferase family 4 protein [uncultured Prevotella sp.]|uniref:glycosyltransferase family 4 protein n=1 Tax=uncultured Prevotella sp. TaxID=159272 RepID=UPI0025E2BA7C|nr:glycosyltransferase family 4 protein [uncultured Prevotella sp.]